MSAKRVIICAVACASVLLAALYALPGRARTHAGDLPGLLETGRAARLTAPEHASSQLKIVSYNMRWRGGKELEKLVELLRDDPEIGGASIIGLQEVDRNKKRTDNTNTARLMADALGMHYAWAAPPPSTERGEEETGVAILSRFPLTDVQRILLPHEGPEGRRRVALGATIETGGRRLRVYSVHAETRMPLARKVEHWRAVLDDLQHRQKIAGSIVLGDFNTIKEKDVQAARRLFTDAGFTTPFPDDLTTWRTFVLELKLDWLWLRGLETTDHGIDKKVDLSDHWPLWAKVRQK